MPFPKHEYDIYSKAIGPMRYLDVYFFRTHEAYGLVVDIYEVWNAYFEGLLSSDG